MKRRVFSLLLCVALLLSTLSLVSCRNDDEGLEEEEERHAMTLSLIMVTNDSTKKEAVEQVQDAINAITMAKFKTQVVITTFTESEYNRKLDDRFTALEKAAAEAKAEAESRKKAEKEAKKRGETIKKETTSKETTAEETEYNEFGFSQLKYPALTDNQIDIFFLSGLDQLMEYNSKERCAMLDDELNSSSKKIKDFLYPTFLNAAKIEGSSMAVLNNHAIGEYTMLLINKELADKYYYDTTEYKTLSDAVDFIDDMAKTEPSYTPFLRKVDCYDYCTWGEGLSMFGTEVTDNTVYGASILPNIIFRSDRFKTHYSLMRRFEEMGYFSKDPDNDTNFAAAVVTGSLQDKMAYEENYYVTVLQQPRAYNDDIYQGMFCVNGASDSNRVKRCMEVVMMMMTDPDFANLLQYGIEGVHYKLQSGKVVRLNNDYSMKHINTGNEFLTYAEADMPDDIWELGKKQNLDSTTYCLLSYQFSDSDLKLFREANEEAEQIYDLIEKASYAELIKETIPTGTDAFLNPFEAAIDEARYVKNSNSITSTSLDSNFAARLSAWFQSNF